jgi:hypothetical protein
MSGIPVSSQAPLDREADSLRRSVATALRLKVENEALRQRLEECDRREADSRKDVQLLMQLNGKLDTQLKEARRKQNAADGQTLECCLGMFKGLSKHVTQLGDLIDAAVAKLEAHGGPRAGASARAGAPAPAAAPARVQAPVPPPKPQLNPPPPPRRPHVLQPVVKIERTEDDGRYHPYQRPSGGGGAAGHVRSRVITSAPARPTDSQQLPGNPARVVCSAVASSAHAQGVYNSSAPTPAATRHCSCDGRKEAMWFCHDCEQSMCRECERAHMVQWFDPPHAISNLTGRPRVGEGPRP